MIDRLSHKLEACLHLKNEWGHSKTLSLLAKARQSACTQEQGENQRRKRGQYRGKEKMREGLETGIPELKTMRRKVDGVADNKPQADLGEENTGTVRRYQAQGPVPLCL